MITDSDEWIINYIPDEGGRFTGTLTVNNNELRFVTLYESSNKTMVKAIFLDVASFTASGGHAVYRYSNDREATIVLPASEISGVQAGRKGLFKRAVITMKNGQGFVFDYGLLSVGKLVDRISSLISG
jgi:hypothetical protein